MGLYFGLNIYVLLRRVPLSKCHDFAFRLLMACLRVKSGPLFIRKRATFYAKTDRLFPLFRSFKVWGCVAK